MATPCARPLASSAAMHRMLTSSCVAAFRQRERTLRALQSPSPEEVEELRQLEEKSTNLRAKADAERVA
eukprot:32272-Lingulodinium_polyedra.AAC.1